MGEVKKAILFITFVGIALFVSTCAKKEPVEEGRCKLKFASISSQNDVLVALATQEIAGTKDKPSEIKDLPPRLTTGCVYFLAKVIGKSIPMVLAYYNRLEYSILYMDTNGDGRLSDEKPYQPKIENRSRYKYVFGPFLCKSHDSEGDHQTEIYATTDHGQFLSLQPSGYRTGKVRLGENTYKVAVIDGNRDGRYDKIFSLPTDKTDLIGCDVFAIDLNQSDKKWHLSLFERSEIMPLGRMIKVQNSYYGINVAPNGTTLELKKIEPEFGTLDFGGANVKLKLWSDTGDHYLFGSEGCWQLPAGIYKALFIELNQTDTERNVWTFSGRPKAGPLHDFEILPGQTTSFKIGPPFTIKTDVRQVTDRVLIGLKLEGCAEEQYTGPVMKGGKQLPTPIFKILNENGKVLTSGHFEYG